jgi:hypothetical protein
MKKPLNFDLLVEDMGVGMSRTPTYTGAPEGIRTLNLLIRSQALCPIELRGRTFNKTAIYGGGHKTLPHIWRPLKR